MMRFENIWRTLKEIWQCSFRPYPKGVLEMLWWIKKNLLECWMPRGSVNKTWVEILHTPYKMMTILQDIKNIETEKILRVFYQSNYISFYFLLPKNCLIKSDFIFFISLILFIFEVNFIFFKLVLSLQVETYFSWLEYLSIHFVSRQECMLSLLYYYLNLFYSDLSKLLLLFFYR